jgi:N-acetylmuramoyl-L-alanine amidase
MLVLHYTAMVDAPAAAARLTDPRAEVSSHYLVDRAGGILALVPEERRAWHAGESSWQGQKDLNSRSIGIEIDHPGHEGGNPPFPDAQIEAVIGLCRGILARWPIPPDRVLAHSDIAPARKQDPGERFPWDRLHREGVGHWVEPADLADPDGAREDARAVQGLLRNYGYGIEPTGVFDARTAAVLAAFQRHFRPRRVDGLADASTLDTLRRLLAARSRAA